MKILNMLSGLLCASIALAGPLEDGRAFAQSGDHEKAIALYRAHLETSPKEAEAYFLAGESYAALKNYSRALANYRLAYRYAPEMTRAYEGAAKVYEALGDKKQADAERLKDPKNRPKEEPEIISAPPIEEASAEPTKEVTTKEMPAKEPPAQPTKEPLAKETPAQELPKVSSEEKKETVLKSNEKEKISTEKSEKSSGFTYDDPLFKKGRELFNEKKYAEAASVWREVLKQQPGNPGAYYFAGAGRYELGEMDKAEYNLKRAFDFPELGYNAHYYLSLVYKKQKKEKAEAEALRAYIKLTSNVSAKEEAKKRLAELENPKQETKKEAEIKKEASPLKQENQKIAAPEKNAEEKDSKKAAESVTPKETQSEEKAIEEKLAEQTEKSEEKKAEKIKAPATIESSNASLSRGKYNEALAGYKELLEVGELSDENKAFVMLQIGNIYRERRDYRLAVARYREIVETYPDIIWAIEAERAWKDAVWQENHAGELPRKR